jgi:predicted Zn-dependent peptidase
MERFDFPNLGETLYKTVLSNGLSVAVVPRAGFNRKIAYFVTDFGGIHRDFTVNGEHIQVPGGIAHYLEHKLFDMPDMDVTARFASMGASPNAFTSYDITAYYFNCTDHFEACLQLLLQFVSTPYFTEESVQKEQGIIGQEIGMNEDNPDTRIFENLVSAMYRVHPVTVPILGTRESIAQITPQLLEACHRAFYRPKNMLLCVVGDVDPEAVCQMAENILPADTLVVSRVDAWQEEMTVKESVVRQTMEVAMPMFQLGFKCEPLGLGESAVRGEAVGELAAEVLFGESSRLYLQLYEEGLIDSSFGGGFDTLDGLAMLTAYGDSRNPEAVRDAILQEAQRIVQEGVPGETLLRLKRSAMGRRVRELDSFDSTAFRVCAYHLSGFDYFRFPEIYAAVEEADILDFLSRVVRQERCALSIVEPL